MFCWAIFLKGMSAQLIKVNSHCIFYGKPLGKQTYLAVWAMAVKLLNYQKFKRYSVGGKSARQLSDEQGICIGTIRSRISAGWTDEEMLRGYRLNNNPKYNGLTIKQIAKKQGVRYDSVRDRKSRGWSDEEIADPSKRKKGYLIKWRGEIKTLAELARDYSVSLKVLRNRMKEYYRIDDAIKASLKHRGYEKYVSDSN